MLRFLFYALAAFALASTDSDLSVCEGAACEEVVSVQLLQQDITLSNLRVDADRGRARSQRDETTATTTPDPTGVSLNAVGDLTAFVSALITNVVSIVVFVLMFSVLRLRYPKIYSNNVKCEEPFAPKMDAQATYTIKPSSDKQLGMDCDADGIVTSVSDDGQAKENDIRVGDKVLKVDAPELVKGKNSKADLDKVQNGKSDYKVTLKIDRPPDTMFGWVKFALFTPIEESAKSIGLDNALMLEFTHLCMKILAIIGTPMICIIGVMNWNLGGLAMCTADGCDHMSSFSFGNVLSTKQAKELGVPTPWLYWVHALCVWGVVLTVQIFVYRAQENFLKMRYAWLHSMPKKRACTLMVEGITQEWRTDAKLKDFFKKNVEGSNVVCATVVKDTSKLAPLVAQRHAFEDAKLKAEAQVKAAAEKGEAKEEPQVRPSFMAAKVPAIPYYNKQIEKLTADIAGERKRIEELETKADGGVTLDVGFVEFDSRYHASVALALNYTQDNEEWVVSVPPQASDILWGDLTQDPTAQRGRTVTGYALIVGLFFAYMPCVLGITNIAKIIDMGPLQPLWQGLAPTLGLQFMVAMLPTFLNLIFVFFFTLKAEAWAQRRIQNWYYAFQVFFVILATSVGQDVTGFMNALFTDPFSMFSVMANTMPYSTHFYMNYLVLQWVTHSMNLLRYVPLAKYKSFSALFDDEEARRRSEPEDQDYYGIGSRSARWAINMNLGIVFGTLSPPINLLAFLNFFVCKLFYGYLIPFAETKKADLGGEFWVAMMKHLFFGNIIYCILMTGVFVERAETWGPAIIAAPSVFYVIWSMQRFEGKFAWEQLPNTQVVHIDPRTGEETHPVPPTGTSREYTQPELNDK